MLIKKLREDLKQAMINEVKSRKEHKEVSENDIAIKTSCRAIISMFPEIGKKPADATDEDVIKLGKKYIKSEKIRLLYSMKVLGPDNVGGLSTSDLSKLVNAKLIEHDEVLTSLSIKHIKSYLPKALSEGEIVSWIKDNIDFTQFKNKMQAMKPIMIHFEGAADGNLVRQIIQKSF